MQVTSRPAPFLASLLVAITACADTTGQGGGPPAALALRPVFPAPVTAGVFDLAVDRVRIRVIRPPASVVVDTSVPFPSGKNELTVRVRVPPAVRRERLVAALELYSRETLLFAGTETFEVIEGSTATPSVTLQYVGPGREMTHLRIEPRDTALRPNDRFTFTVTASSFGEPLERFYVGWSSSDPNVAPVDAVGTLAAPDQRGQVVLRVVSPTGVRDSTRISFSPPATTLEGTGGDGQTGFAGQALPQPLVARAVAGDGLGVPGVRVSFSSLYNGRVSDTLVITDAQGLAATTGVLGPAAGPQAFLAAASGLTTVSFLATAVIGPASRIQAFAGQDQVDTVGHALRTPLIARVTDEVGNPVAGVPVDWSVVAGGGTLGPMSTETNLSGLVFAEYTLGPVPAPNVVQAAMANQPGVVDFRATAVAGTPAFIAIHSGNAQADTAGATLAPFVVIVTDRLGNLLSGVPVQWSEVQGGGSLHPEVSGTNSEGRAQTTYRLPTTVGTVNVAAEVIGQSLSIVLRATVRAATASAITAMSGDGQTAMIGSVLTPFAVRVTDQFGNPAPGTTVTWVVESGGGTLSADESVTDPDGVAMVTYTLGPVPGANAVRARLPNGVSIVFSATATP